MAKHPHRLMLNQKKTWRCTLPGCKYFIHIGLAHILPGQQAICWDCGEEFTLDERALENDQPVCASCSLRSAGVDVEGMEAYTERMLAQARTVKKVVEAPRASIVHKSVQEDDEIEVIEPDEVHMPDCGVYAGTECTCK